MVKKILLLFNVSVTGTLKTGLSVRGQTFPFIVTDPVKTTLLLHAASIRSKESVIRVKNLLVLFIIESSVFPPALLMLMAGFIFMRLIETCQAVIL